MGLGFTHAGYRILLSRLLAAGYTPAAFGEGEGLLARGARFVLLRHDIDFDLTPALAMARIEAEMGLFSTWFVLVRTEHYNPFSAESSRILGEILGMGHRLGLHFDCAAYPDATADQLNAACGKEAALLEDWFGVDVPVVSFHRPTPALVGSDGALTAPRLHTYMPLFCGPIHYRADSRGLWRYGEPLDSPAFLAGKPLHLLVHPIWWRENETTPVQTLYDFIDCRNRQLEASVASNSTVYQPRNR
ncbi:MAG: hypothetical protein KJZ86_22040 [Caldilineaceae bacterium]|nr:hypothetical protein [Caldilineaceae bacterium]HRJ45036.1 hypothetical protein [Caldilineaceae bacterium]